MENGLQNGISTNHDKNNGATMNGDIARIDRSNSATNASDTAPNMANGTSSSWRMNDLPDEIRHITEGFVPLGLLLSRLAQMTHNQLQAKILTLSKINMPPAAVLNGNSGPLVDDTVTESRAKKQDLIEFIQETHGKWVKALVITSWSRKVGDVSKLIDLMAHINEHRMCYEDTLGTLIDLKRDLVGARLPNPDLQTALQVLATGEAPWLPDFNYVPPPPMTAEEQMRWIEELNTLLSIRLNLEDHDKIPYHFRDYSIDSGRVTFKVPGEFEVDLTIADEDFDKQFWFLDFRFSCSPAPVKLTDTLYLFMEARVNEALEKDGLQGCYDFLHEFVLTHKVTEFTRQAFEMQRGLWVDTLKVERLNRAMSIQYWTTRFAPSAPKSWIILGVHSGKRTGVVSHPSQTSYISLRWFKDGKEVKDVPIEFNDAEISAESLLKQVIARHTEQILSSMYQKLQTKDRYMRKEAAISLQVSTPEPAQMALKMQLISRDSVALHIVPTTGLFVLSPPLPSIMSSEGRLNAAKDPSEDGLGVLEALRCTYVMKEIGRRGKSLDWNLCRGPLRPDDVKPILQTRDFQTLWLTRRGWPAHWFVMLSLSPSGDRWWLIETTQSATPNSGAKLSTYTQLPLTPGLPDFSDNFFHNLTVFSAALISHVIDLKTLHSRKVKHLVGNLGTGSLPPNVQIPAIVVRLSDILKLGRSGGSTRISSWAEDFVYIEFKGTGNRNRRRRAKATVTEGTPGQPGQQPGDDGQEPQRLNTMIEARFKVSDRAKFSLLKGHVERDVAFNPRLGVFALRLGAHVGTTIFESLAHRLQAIERLVDCIDAIRKSDNDIKCESITLSQVVFSYSDAIGRKAGPQAQANLHRWNATLDLRKDQIALKLEKGNPHLRSLDSFTTVLNSPLGFSKIPLYLALTLPLLKALDAIVDAWVPLDANHQGRVEVFPSGIDSYNIRYTFPVGSDRRTPPRKVVIRAKLQTKQNQHNKPLWQVTRVLEPQAAAAAAAPGAQDDEFGKALKKVWEPSSDKGWRGFTTSAACDTDDTIALLLQATDQALREASKKIPSPKAVKQAPPNPAPLKGPAAAAAAAAAAKNQHPHPTQQQQTSMAMKNNNHNNNGPPMNLKMPQQVMNRARSQQQVHRQGPPQQQQPQHHDNLVVIDP
ncbi:mediator complex subunit MED14 [Apiospora arundinis]|uniref:Mediator of RNA polymerase II transcription subunit 14 n=1 Tax=Apiospora arundinis TaxID=335852 RepID=A0ABR2JBX9_9PEZI